MSYTPDFLEIRDFLYIRDILEEQIGQNVNYCLAGWGFV